MVFDPKARIVSMNFAGGSVSAELGLLEAVFGPELSSAATAAETSTVSVSGHSRVRVIGGPATSVGAFNYTRKKYPSSQASGGAGGEAIALLSDGKYWTARLSGSHQSFNTFLDNVSEAGGGPIFWKSEKGKKYGPF
jgi:hypothetical protein